MSVTVTSLLFVHQVNTTDAADPDSFLASYLLDAFIQIVASDFLDDLSKP